MPPLFITPFLLVAIALLAWCLLRERRGWLAKPGVRDDSGTTPGSGTERRILDNLTTVPWEWDLQEGRYTFVGRKVEDLFGYPVEQWYGTKLWLESLHPEDIEQVERSFMYAVWKGGTGTYRYRVIHRTGCTVPVESTVSTLLENGRPRYVCGTTRALQEENPVLW
jgi:PAS domain S-box-containing protein